MPLAAVSTVFQESVFLVVTQLFTPKQRIRFRNDAGDGDEAADFSETAEPTETASLPSTATYAARAPAKKQQDDTTQACSRGGAARSSSIADHWCQCGQRDQSFRIETQSRSIEDGRQ